MNDGGYAAKNGAREAPQHRSATDGSVLGDDFPMLCETCLGPNPYVRMTKLPFGYKLCKISNLPFQAFKWKAGPGGRHKETMISYAVAAERNICQTCLLDMKYGLPVGVRDSLLGQADNQIALPQSHAGQQYFYENQQQLVESGQINHNQISNDITNVVGSRQLDRFARVMQAAEAKSKTAWRNLPKLCSFWLNGTCTRVLDKKCPFRPCCGEFAFPEIAGSHRELCAKLVDRLRQEGPAAVQKSLDAETRQAISQALKGNRDDAMRKRVGGDDDLTRKYLGKMKKMNLQLDPPADMSIITLWIGNIEEDITEADIRAVIYPYGQIASFHMVRSAKCAFVEYVDREAAESAAAQLYQALVVQGRALNVNWAKPRTQQPQGLDLLVAGGGEGASSIMPAPPGMEKAPISAYALPGLPAPVSTWDKQQQVAAIATGGGGGGGGGTKRPRPVPPAGPPPASAFGNSGSSGGSGGGLLAGLSAYGDDDSDGDNDAATGVALVGSSSERGGGGGGGGGGGKRAKIMVGSASSAVGTGSGSGPVQYPSMNPTRLGTSV